MSTVCLLVFFDGINKRINVPTKIVSVKLCAVVIAFTAIDYICFAELLRFHFVFSGLYFLKL